MPLTPSARLKPLTSKGFVTAGSSRITWRAPVHTPVVPLSARSDRRPECFSFASTVYDCWGVQLASTVLRPSASKRSMASS